MEILYLLLGVALLLLATTDALWTTLWVDGSSGPLSSRLTAVLWRLIRALSPGRNHRWLGLAGPVILDDALTLMQHGVPGEYRPDPVALKAARASVQGDLSPVNPAFIDPAPQAPPAPDLGRLRAAGVPALPDAAFAGAVEDLRERRRRVLGLMRNDAWRWLPLEEVRA